MTIQIEVGREGTWRGPWKRWSDNLQKARQDEDEVTIGKQAQWKIQKEMEKELQA